MNTADFDRAMRALASAEAPIASDDRLRRTLADLPDAPCAEAPIASHDRLRRTLADLPDVPHAKAPIASHERLRRTLADLPDAPRAEAPIASHDRLRRTLADLPDAPRAEAPIASSDRLRRTLADLPDAPRAKAPRLRLLPALLALLLISGVAVAARLGLLSFWQQNPYNFFHNREGAQPELRLAPLEVLDASGLHRLAVEPLDSAWIEGRLTLTVRLTADAALTAGEREGDRVRLSAPVGEDAQWVPLDEVGLLLYPEDTACAVGSWSAYAEHAECQLSDDGVTLALQFPPELVTASDLPALLDAQGRLPLRLDLNVYDPAADAFTLETVRIAVAAPTGEERMEMDP